MTVYFFTIKIYWEFSKHNLGRWIELTLIISLNDNFFKFDDRNPLRAISYNGHNAFRRKG